MLFVVFIAAIVIGTAILIVAMYALFGKGPRLRCAFTRIEHLLDEGEWSSAIEQIGTLQQETGLSPDDTPPEHSAGARWVRTLRSVSGKRIRRPGTIFSRTRSSTRRSTMACAATLLETPAAEARGRVVDAMLAELRRLFAAGSGTSDLLPVFELLVRIGNVQPSCPEASFWQGLCLVRQNQLEPALKVLTQVHEQVGKNYIDPAFYMGGVLHRLGRHQEAVRLLGEANRVDPNCPFVTLQMGLALVAASGDSSIAVRALQRAVGPRGLVLWQQNPQRAWVEAFPEGRSFVCRLATKYAYVCPLLGSDLTAIIRQGNLALAQAHYRGGNFQEAADLYTKLMQDSAPTLPLLRGLGLSLARLQRDDQAFKHLRAALELDDAKDPFTAGYLALCGAMGKPTNPDDKPKNVTWGIRLITRYQLSSNVEWAGIWSAIFAEARALKMTLAEEDQVQLCNVLASVNACDAGAAAAYSQLAGTFPQSIVPRHAWLYCQAATVHDFRGPADLDLFALTFRDPKATGDFFARQKWDLDEVHYSYLRAARSWRRAGSPRRWGRPMRNRGKRSCWSARKKRRPPSTRRQPRR